MYIYSYHYKNLLLNFYIDKIDIGLKGRIRLQKMDERKNSRNWMDQQRKNLQAYEYLCHIGEAKE